MTSDTKTKPVPHTLAGGWKFLSVRKIPNQDAVELHFEDGDDTMRETVNLVNLTVGDEPESGSIALGFFAMETGEMRHVYQLSNS